MSDDVKMVKLISMEREIFPVTLEAAMMSNLVKSALEDVMEDDNANDTSSSSSEEGIDIPKVSGHILKQVIDFCDHYTRVEKMKYIEKPLKTTNMADVVQAWYADYIYALTPQELFEVILAANYMDIIPLLELTCATVASKVKGKTPEEMRTVFHNKVDTRTKNQEEEQQNEHGKRVHD